jgi:hypothetical protein
MKKNPQRLLILALVGFAAFTIVEAADLTPFAISAPAVVMDFDGHTIQGDPVQLAISSQPGVFYLQTADGYAPNVTIRHYTITLGDKAPAKTKSEPPWADQYWAFKSRRDAPAQHDLLISVETRVENNRLPTQSLADKARGMESGGGAIAMRGAEEAANDSKNATRIRALKLKGTTIGEFYDEAPLLPGLTFGWSPESQHAVAFADGSGKLAVMDYFLDATQKIDATENVLLPAWTMDGTKIVFLERTGKNRYALEQVTISRK